MYVLKRMGYQVGGLHSDEYHEHHIEWWNTNHRYNQNETTDDGLQDE
jgi:hypothetical protein